MNHATLLSRCLAMCVLSLLSVKTLAANARYNSINELPRNLYFADVDGDTKMEFVQFGKNRVFSFEPDPDNTGRFHYYSRYEFKKIIVGAFRETGHSEGRDDLCFIRTDDVLDCYTISPDGKSLWWWFRQNNFIAESQQIVVGDYDNDGTEDLALYKSSTGELKFYAIRSSGNFFESANISLGNIASRISANGRIYAGRFTGDAGSDLLFVNGGGQALYFRSVTSSGERTFWWSFTTTKEFDSADQILIGNVDGGSADSIIKRSDNTGAHTFYSAAYDNGRLKKMADVTPGQLPEMATANSVAYFGKLAGYESEPGNLRDDAIIYDKSTNQIRKTDARYNSDEKKMSYWWHYTLGASKMHSGWPSRQSYKIAIVKCIDGNDSESNLPTDAYLEDIFSRGESNNLNDYFMDISLGKVDLENITLFGNYAVNYQSGTTRGDKIDLCVNNIGSKKSDYDRVIALTTDSEYGGVGSTKLLLNKSSFRVSTGAHEIMHTFGADESRGETEKRNCGSWCGGPGVYQNKYDIMSANNIYTWNTSDFGKAGPNLMPFLQKEHLDNLPSHKYYSATNSGSSQESHTITLTSTSLPESPNYIAGDYSTYKGGRYTVEYRTKTGWDRAIPREGIIINRVTATPRAYAIWNEEDTGVLVLTEVGDTWEDAEKGIRIELISIDNDRGIAKVKVEY
jgi:hypothetical protein